MQASEYPSEQGNDDGSQTKQPAERTQERQRRLRPQEPSQSQVAAHIAEQLQVTDEQGRSQILTLVQELGRTQARALCEEALQLAAQENGDQDHRRSLGDIFLHLTHTRGKPKERPWKKSREVAARIADQLGEVEDVPRAQILRIVLIQGEEKALHYLEET